MVRRTKTSSSDGSLASAYQVEHSGGSRVDREFTPVISRIRSHAGASSMRGKTSYPSFCGPAGGLGF